MICYVDVAVSAEVPVGSSPDVPGRGGLYQYTVPARDADGDPLTFTLTSAPDGMTIDPNGLITWTPAVAGTPTVTVEVSDGRGGAGVQAFTLTARAHQPPMLTPIADATTALGGTFRAVARATDTEGDPLTFALEQAPAGMTIDPQGRILWAPAGDPRTETVRVRVTDSGGLGATDEFAATLVADTEAPRVVVLSNTLANLGRPVRVAVRATDNVGVAGRTLIVAHGGTATEQPLTADGQAVFTPSAPGRYTFTAKATDAAGNAGTVTAEPRALDPSDQAGPDVAFTRVVPLRPGGKSTPLDPNAGPVTVTYLADVYGTSTDPDGPIDSRRLLVARAADVDPADMNRDGPQWREIGSGTVAVTDGRLATFDPTTLPNDRYVLLLARGARPDGAPRRNPRRPRRRGVNPSEYLRVRARRRGPNHRGRGPGRPPHPVRLRRGREPHDGDGPTRPHDPPHLPRRPATLPGRGVRPAGPAGREDRVRRLRPGRRPHRRQRSPDRAGVRPGDVHRDGDGRPRQPDRAHPQ